VKAKRRARTASQKKAAASEGESESEPDATSDNETLHASDVELSFKNLFQDIRTTIGAPFPATHTHTHVCAVRCVICVVYHQWLNRMSEQIIFTARRS
jgi:hypothetical protein